MSCPPSQQADRRSSCRGERSRETGSLGEDLAAEHLRRLGFAILARNLRGARGEIDLIAADGSVIAFVEVKTTRSRRRGAGASRGGMPPVPLERLSVGQRRRLRGLALDWLRDRCTGPFRAETIRFDAIGVVIDPGGGLLALEHVEDAW